MPSITDDLMGKTPEGAKKTVETSAKALKEVKAGIKEAKATVKGICLLLINGSEFTADAVMNAVRKVAFRKTGDIKFSKNNIDISELRKSGHVYQVEENILQEAMKYFDKHCKERGVKYSAMKDTRNEDKPAYMVFFEGKDSDLILGVLREAYKDYAEEQQKMKEAEKSGRESDEPDKRQKHNRRQKKNQEQSGKRESVKTKLAFFRDRVAARDKERDVMEKHHQHSDIQR